jgi:AcrR family transcriptional regulator
MTAEFLWGERAPRTRGPKPAMSLDQIADAAIAVADTEGLAAVSMQRVAADLGYTKMSLYRYVPGKAELVSVMLERAIGEPPVLSVDGWREALTQWCHQLLARYVRHPWAPEAMLGPRPLGPYELGWMDRAVAVLPAGLTGAERLDAIGVLALHARNLGAQESSRQRETEFAAEIGTVLARHADRFPAVAAAMADVAVTGGQDRAFDFGVARILDGLDVLVSRRAATSPVHPAEGPRRS